MFPPVFSEPLYSVMNKGFYIYVLSLSFVAIICLSIWMLWWCSISLIRIINDCLCANLAVMIQISEILITGFCLHNPVAAVPVMLYRKLSLAWLLCPKLKKWHWSLCKAFMWWFAYLQIFVYAAHTSKRCLRLCFLNLTQLYWFSSQRCISKSVDSQLILPLLNR